MKKVSSLTKWLRIQLATVIVSAIDKSIDGRDVSQYLEKQLDAFIDEESSEKIQRGPIANFIKEILEGLFIENNEDLIAFIDNWKEELK